MVYSRVRVLGEQLNPLLTVLPLAMLGTAVLSDVGALLGGAEFFGQVAYWDMAAGLVAGLIALCAVLVDLVVAPAESQARRVLAVVSATSSAMVMLFIVVWSIRADQPGAVNGWLLLVELAALGAGVTGAVVARGLIAGAGLPERPPLRRPNRRPIPRPFAPAAAPTLGSAATPATVPAGGPTSAPSAPAFPVASPAHVPAPRPYPVIEGSARS